MWNSGAAAPRHPEAPVPPSLSSRIAQLARRDRVLAISFTVLMWAVLIFLCVVASATAPSPAITVVLLASALLLGAFNTASVLAMLRSYAANREAIYRDDVLLADRRRELRAQGPW